MAVLHDNTSRIQGLVNDINNLPKDRYEEGYELGHTEGYEAGSKEGHATGYAEGLAARTYETWTITLTDGTVVEKDVALL